MRLCFIDTETTGLDRKRRQIWDFACIVRNIDAVGKYTDVEYQFFIDVSLEDADPFGLKVGHFWERYPGRAVTGVPAVREDTNSFKTGSLVGEYTAAHLILQMTTNAIWVGAVPSFDEETCAKLLRRQGLIGRWDYHLVDVETAGAALAGIAPPWKNDVVNLAYNIKIPTADRHTAIGDARAVRDLYDAVFKL